MAQAKQAARPTKVAKTAKPASVPANTRQKPSRDAGRKPPNILVIWGDDIGIANLSCYTHGLMGYHTPNIDRIANEGMRFTDSYGEQSCTAGRSSFITGQSVHRTGLSKVGSPDLSSIEAADIVLVGTWTHGFFVVGQQPWALGKIANLPTMRGKKAACFLTFALNAGKSIDKLSTAVGQTGAEVVGGLEIKRNYIDQHTDLFVERLLGAVASA